LVFLYLFGQFASKYLLIKGREDEEFEINTSTLFPTKKYNIVTKNVTNSNTKSVSFLMASLVFIVWSFLAGHMLPL